MRFIIDMDEARPNRVEGRVHREVDHTTLSFSGWLELLSLLEPPSTPKGDRHADE